MLASVPTVPRRVLLASALGVVLTTVVTAGCTPADEAEPTPAAPSPTAGWPVEVDSAAVALASTPQGLIAVTPGSSRFPPQVHRFDAAGTRVARQAAVGMPNGLAVAPDGGAWVPAVRHPDMPAGTGVPVLDPVSLRPRREIDVGTDPFSVAFVGDEAWVGTAGAVAVVDARTGARRRSVPLRGTAYQLVAVPAAGTVLAVLGDGVAALDARTGRVLAQRPLATTGSITAVLAGHALWVAWPVEGGTLLRRFDPRTLRPGAGGPRFGDRGVAIAAAGERLWVADHGSGRLQCLDPASGAVRGTRPVPNTAALAADDRWVYAADDVVVRRVDAACG